MICIFNDGTLSGLQFEMENPPHRIRAESLSIKHHTISAAPYDALPTAPSELYKRVSETYIRTEVHVSTEGTLSSLDEQLQGTVIVYHLERVW